MIKLEIQLLHNVDDATGHIHHIRSYCHTRLIARNHSRFLFDGQVSIAARGLQEQYCVEIAGVGFCGNNL